MSDCFSSDEPGSFPTEGRAWNGSKKLRRGLGSIKDSADLLLDAGNLVSELLAYFIPLLYPCISIDTL